MSYWMRFSLASLLVFVGLVSSSIDAISQTNIDVEGANKPSTESKEQTIYVPYDKLQDVFERQGRGVFIPYEKFQELWQAARTNAKVLTPPVLPVEALIVEVDSEAQVEKEVVRVSSRLTIEVLKKGWVSIPLRLADTAILSAKLDDEAARILPSEGGGYHLLFDNTTAKANAPNRSLVLKIEYAKAIVKSPGKSSVSFDAPQSPVNRWLIRVPEKGVKIQVTPMLAASEVPPDRLESVLSPDSNRDGTLVQAFVGAAPQVRIEWNPKSEGAIGMSAMANVQCLQQVSIDEGVVRTRANLNYTISRAELSEISIEIPGDQKVVNVFDPNVRKWEIKKENDLQAIRIQLFEPARQSQNIVLEMERLSHDEKDRLISIAQIRALNVGQQGGIVTINVGAGLRAEPTKRSGLMQMDAAELPQNLKNETSGFAFRYSGLPFDLALNVDKIEPQIAVDQLTEVYLDPQQMAMEVYSIHAIEQAGLFQLDFELPAGFEVRRVLGRESPGVSAAVIDGFKLTGEKKTHLVVNLARKTTGRIGLGLQLQRSLNEPNLLTPTGEMVPVQWSIPRAVNPFITRLTGHLVVYAPESLRVTPVRSDGMRVVSTSEAIVTVPSTRDGKYPILRETLSLAHAEQPVSIEVSVERRKPMVTVRQLLSARVESGVVKYDATFFYDVRYSGIRSVRIDIPTDLVGQIRNRTTSARESTFEQAPNDAEPNDTAWKFTGETEWLGNFEIQLSWESKLNELEIGKTVTISLPRLTPRGTDRAWGQIVFAKAESIDVQPTEETSGVRPIDPQFDLIQNAKTPSAARAFEFQDRWSLGMEVTRYALEDVKRTSIERALLRMVVTRSRQTTVQALYRMRSARQRLAITLPKDIEFDSQPLRIDGVPVALERGDGDQLFVPLAGRDPSQAIVLELRYTMQGNQSQLTIPSFPEDPAVQKTYISLFMPKEIALLGTQGPWTDEFAWNQQGFWKAEPCVAQNDDQLLSWVQEGITMASSPSFQKDGTLYVFSTLNPAATPEAALRLVTIHEKLLAFIVFAVAILMGLFMLRRSWRYKCIAIAFVLSTVFLIGVFIPTFAHQVLRAPMWAASAIVGLIWGTRAVLSDPFKRAHRRTHSEGSSLTMGSGAPDKSSNDSSPVLPSLFHEASSGELPKTTPSSNLDDTKGGE